MIWLCPWESHQCPEDFPFQMPTYRAFPIHPIDFSLVSGGLNPQAPNSLDKSSIWPPNKTQIVYIWAVWEVAKVPRDFLNVWVMGLMQLSPYWSIRKLDGECRCWNHNPPPSGCVHFHIHFWGMLLKKILESKLSYQLLESACGGRKPFQIKFPYADMSVTYTLSALLLLPSFCWSQSSPKLNTAT